jgi:hypothetical protein
MRVVQKLKAKKNRLEGREITTVKVETILLAAQTLLPAISILFCI